MNISTHCSIRKKITALLLSLCMAGAFVPSVSAGAVADDNTTQTVQAAESTTQATESTTQAAESTTQATESTTQSTESTTQATESTTQATESTTKTVELTQPTHSFTQTSSAQSSGGFQNVETDGGVLFVGTARTPKDGGGISTVKFVYSSSLNLNDKSLALINKELAACGVTIPDGMIYVSASDIVSDSQLMTNTSENRAVFAVGTPSAPTVLKACPAYGSVEESFERLFRGYIFNISGYSSLKPVFMDREEIKLSEDGQTASTSIVMSEDYVEKVINGQKIKILMINSELKYYFRAPKLTFEKDEDYNVSDSDVIYHYPSRSTTDPSDTLTEATTKSTTASTQPSSDEDGDTTGSTTEPTGTVIDTTDATEPTEPTEPTDPEDPDDTSSTTGITDPFPDDDTTRTLGTTSTSTRNPESTTAESTRATTNNTTVDPDRLIPYAKPIDSLPTRSTTKQTTLPTELTTESTTGSTTEPTSRITLPTTTQTTRDKSIIDPYNNRRQNTVGEAYVNTRRLPLNIRSGPGLNYMVVKVIPKGTHLTVLDTSNPDWYMVRLNNKTVGYAYSYYIQFV